MSSKCSICNRPLDVENDPLSADCGGDCWGCIGEIEADMGSQTSIEIVRKEYANGHRPNWMPSPEINFSFDGTIEENVRVTILISIIRPLGEPWSEAELRVKYVLSSQAKKTELKSLDLITDKAGKVSLEYNYPEISDGCEVWVEIERGTNKWSFPLRTTT